MNNRQIDCFIMAATLGNLNQVAETLFLSVSTVSYQIRNLEEELGFPLFHRNNKYLRLTDSGRYYLEQIQQLRALHDTVIERAQSIRESKPKLIVGITRDIAFEHYDTFMNAFQKECSAIELQFVPVSYQDGLHPLEFSTVDMMFTYNCRLKQSVHMDSMALRPSAFYCMVSRQNPIANKAFLTIEDLNETKVFCENENLPWIREITQAEKTRIPIEIQHEMMIPLMVRTNKGISIDTCPLHLSFESGLIYLPLHCKRQIHRVLAWKKESTADGMESFKAITRNILQ